jgi:hypothetical protein
LSASYASPSLDTTIFAVSIDARETRAVSAALLFISRDALLRLVEKIFGGDSLKCLNFLDTSLSAVLDMRQQVHH